MPQLARDDRVTRSLHYWICAGKWMVGMHVSVVTVLPTSRHSAFTVAEENYCLFARKNTAFEMVTHPQRHWDAFVLLMSYTIKRVWQRGSWHTPPLKQRQLNGIRLSVSTLGYVHFFTVTCRNICVLNCHQQSPLNPQTTVKKAASAQLCSDLKTAQNWPWPCQLHLHAT